MQSARGEAEGKESRRNCFCSNRRGVKSRKCESSFPSKKGLFRPVMTLNCHFGTEDNTILFCDGALWGETPHFSRWKSPGNERETANSGWNYILKNRRIPFNAGHRAPLVEYEAFFSTFSLSLRLRLQEKPPVSRALAVVIKFELLDNRSISAGCKLTVDAQRVRVPCVRLITDHKPSVFEHCA